MSGELSNAVVPLETRLGEGRLDSPLSVFCVREETQCLHSVPGKSFNTVVCVRHNSSSLHNAFCLRPEEVSVQQTFLAPARGQKFCRRRSAQLPVFIVQRGNARAKGGSYWPLQGSPLSGHLNHHVGTTVTTTVSRGLTSSSFRVRVHWILLPSRSEVVAMVCRLGQRLFFFVWLME